MKFKVLTYFKDEWRSASREPCVTVLCGFPAGSKVKEREDRNAD